MQNAANSTVNSPAVPLDFDGKAALVTGGSRGIGRAVVLRLAAGGADVAFTYQSNERAAEDVVAEVKALGRRVLAVRADAADAAAADGVVEAAVAEFGRLDILVNNAGAGVLGPIGELSLEDIDRVLAVNIRGVYLTTRAAIAHLGEGGRIIMIGSCMTERVPFPGGTLYTTSKTALTGLTKALARELGPSGVTANIVHPGPVDTEMNPADGPYAEAQAALTAVGRYGRPAEVAEMVAHLVAPSAGYVTGASVSVDGGHAA
ncbi:SDR family oxidoreductase [Streptomyces sp. I05A-00742]|uniref:SDR family oxidoreductase n=1 Tax=Streptomyces sp. I05A-00742 TaxID=2732853 RepID=UPI001487F8F8|nr:SDR family oxidoreductase [Streptomyces sp. I05A-00742]